MIFILLILQKREPVIVIANQNQTNRQAKNSLISVSVKKALKYEREKCEFSGFIDKAMPSNQFYTPFMVDKGIQCVLLRSPVNSFESTSRRDLTCVSSTESHHQSHGDQYNAKIRGDVYNMSMGPTIVYRLDPDVTREVLLGTSNIFDKLDSLTPGYLHQDKSVGQRKKVSFKEIEPYNRIRRNSTNIQTNSELVEVLQLRGKRGRSNSGSSLSDKEIKKPKNNFQTLFIYGVGGVVCNFIIKQRNDSKISY